MRSVTITLLQMCTPEALRPSPCPDPGFTIHERPTPDGTFNRSLYLAVGAPWQWTDKADWSAEQWHAYASSDSLRTFEASLHRSLAGYFELRHDGSGGIEIAYFGLLPDFTGRGLGASMLSTALATAWQSSPQRVWVSTCSLDHPASLRNYLARGMSVYHTETKPLPDSP